MRLLNIVTSPRRERSASIAVIDSFLFEYQKRIKGVVVDTLDVWTESLPEFDAEAIGAKYIETSRYRAVFERPSYLTRLRRTDWLGRRDSNLCISKSDLLNFIPPQRVLGVDRAPR